MAKYKDRFYGFICLFTGLIFCVPVVYTVLNSFMTQAEIISNMKPDETGFIRLRLVPQMVSLSQYAEILVKSPDYLKLFWRSVFYTVIIVTGVALISFFTAYGLYRIKGKASKIISGIYILIMLMPFQVVCVPNFIALSKLGLLDSYWAIILPAIFNPLGTFLMLRYLETVPIEYIQSAQTEGAGEFTILYKIVMPIAKNGIAALSVITFLEYWGMVEQPLVFLQTSAQEPLSSFLAVMAERDIGIVFAASTFYLIPAVLFFLYNNESFVEGIQLSGLR